MKYIYGIDIGGTFVKFGRFDSDYNLLEKWELPVDPSKFSERLAPYVAGGILVDMEKNGINDEDIIGIGMGCPGTITSDTIIHGADNLKLNNISVVKAMEKFIRTKIIMENDANCAALGEYYFGNGKEFDSMAFLTLGTGVGGGVILDGKLIKGYSNAAAEFGHINVDDDETNACTCGLYGCLEQYCSATGIKNLSDGEFSPKELFTVMKYPEYSDTKLYDRVKKIYDEFSYKLAKGCSIISAVINPAVFVIGGGVSNAGDIIIEGVKEKFKELAYSGARNTEFRISSLKNDAGIYGAASLFK